jgi:very-short-patch-repair endonuclease
VSLAEQDAWRALRLMRNEGVHVVRQRRVGRFTVGFAIRKLLARRK